MERHGLQRSPNAAWVVERDSTAAEEPVTTATPVPAA